MIETAAPPVPAKGLFARAIGVITSPRATFEGIAQAPSSFTAMLLVAAGYGVIAALFFYTDVGKSAFLEQALKAQPNNPNAAQGNNMILPYLWIMYGVGAFVWVPVWTVLLSAISYVVFNVVTGGTATFKQIMAIMAHSQFISVLGAAFTFSLNYVRGTLTSATTLGVFVPMLDEKSFVAGFLGAIDILIVLWITWLSIGLAALYRKKTTSVATPLFVIYGVIALAIAYFKSR